MARNYWLRNTGLGLTGKTDAAEAPHTVLSSLEPIVLQHLNADYYYLNRLTPVPGLSLTEPKQTPQPDILLQRAWFEI